jgi:hypothetical protein
MPRSVFLLYSRAFSCKKKKKNRGGHAAQQIVTTQRLAPSARCGGLSVPCVPDHLRPPSVRPPPAAAAAPALPPPPRTAAAAHGPRPTAHGPHCQPTRGLPVGGRPASLTASASASGHPVIHCSLGCSFWFWAPPRSQVPSNVTSSHQQRVHDATRLGRPLGP